MSSRPSAEETLAEVAYSGTCSICGEFGEFKREGRSIRETFLCGRCHGSLRYRGQASAILECYGTPAVGCLADLVHEESFRRLSIYEPGLIGPLRQYFKQVPSYRSSHFWPHVPVGEAFDGIECQDLQRTTYPDESFDLVVSSDIFEHIRKPYVAFKEVLRILKPGGRHVFSVPLTAPMRLKTVIRVDTTTDEDVYVLPPRYHGAPNGGRSLVYTDFGADMIDELERIGMPTQALKLKTPWDKLPALLTFVSQKPKGT